MRLNETEIYFYINVELSLDEQASLVAAMIKHFELCFETAWKFLKEYLQYKYGQKIDSPKKVFRECFVLKIIDSTITQNLLDITEARNATIHDYDEETARETYKRIADYYLVFESLKNIKISK